MGRDVQEAIDETAQLAQRIYPPLLEAAVSPPRCARPRERRYPASPSTSQRRSDHPRSRGAIYWCCLEALEHGRNARR